MFDTGISMLEKLKLRGFPASGPMFWPGLSLHWP
ncbi:hypothetical protein PSPPH_2982 [Pseudomonas savastanoi pv. phaseolicola 1448A]|uniref:Uncharacterized protein n=1 Tax=Pseudomonas savastanoi pv. phaseolicola (strain 1448A / Race 6) TaxID=264730 RepID=Q48HH0_PSE14|nr:hypothetical protein PSPPH_2982 [Pseudomonas savastanoi pv. phaseolicola 1448A]